MTKATPTPAEIAPGVNPLLTAVLNLSRFHRDHEEYYSSLPREQAVVLQPHARTTLRALADRWSTVKPTHRPVLSPYEAEDLNARDAIQLGGVLFLEGEGRPAEITKLIRDLRTLAADALACGEWLSTAMEASWNMASALVPSTGSQTYWANVTGSSPTTGRPRT